MNIRIATAAKSMVAIFVGFLSASALAVVVNLPKYNVSVDQVSVSGLSSGGYMAAQMHVAYSNTIRKGAGIIAGGPVFCSQGNVYIALGPCMADTGSRNLPFLLSVIQTWSAAGAIDPTDDLAASRVYLLSGTLDTTVRQPVMDDLWRMYARFLPAANIAYKNDLAVAHAVPTDFYGNNCGVLEPPYINNCNFDAAGQILSWIYGPLKPKNAGAPSGIVVNFDQTVFWGNHDPNTYGMDKTGYAYVPASCAAGQACRLHIAFHGCDQGAQSVGNAFYADAGYNRWADTNRIVVLYPQAIATAINPHGCWDWLRLYDTHFATKSGAQMVAVKTMIDRIVSGNARAPFACTEVFSSNVAHVAGGRAYVGAGTQVYAVNSNQYLGFYSAFAYTSVRNTAPGYFAYGNCS